MRINTTKAILLLLCLYAITKANGQAGTFDSSFGLNGLVETDFTNIQSESALRVLRQQDGKLVVLFNARGASWLSRYFNNGTKDLNFTDYTEEQYNNGFIQLQAGTAFQASDLALQKNGNLLVAGNVKGDQLDFSLVQHLPSGFTDNGFGNNGQVITSITPGQNDNATAMAIQQDGKIVVVGCTNTGSQRDFAIVRYNTDGSLDNTFSGDGKLTTDFNSGNDTALAVILQPDGKILVGGVSTANSSQKKSFALARYNSNGTLDLTFSGDGKLTTDISMGDDVLKSLSLQSDGKILAGGYTTTGQTDFALVRYLSDGTLDNTFDGDGKLTTDIAQGSSDTLQSIAVQGDGKILAGGFTRSARGYDFALVRYLSGGVMDPAFATGGKNIADQGTPLDIANQMVLLQDGKILMAGQRGSDQTDLVVTRFTTTGLPDPTMLGNGRIVDHLKGSSIYYAMAIQRDGRIVAGGATSDVNTHGTHHDYALARYLINGQLDP
ncbi:MAG TPA: delta-60 repeat domain-containing protein, partial [Flavisolibacter sp.]|nr:delta-60 repeat domain-containing protein [Flavisolibacter sp.]